MAKTRVKTSHTNGKSNNKGTMRRRTGGSSSKSHIDIKKAALKLLGLADTVKLYHWRTTSYPMHKNTDGLGDELNGKIDLFMENLLGMTGVTGKSNAFSLKGVNSIPVKIINTPEEMKKYINDVKQYLLHGLGKNVPSSVQNVRDDILTDLNKFLYLANFK